MLSFCIFIYRKIHNQSDSISLFQKPAPAHTFHLQHHCYAHQVVPFLPEWKHILAESCAEEALRKQSQAPSRASVIYPIVSFGKILDLKSYVSKVVTSWETRQVYGDAFAHLCRQWLRWGSPGLSWLLWCCETLGLSWSRDRRDTSLSREGRGQRGRQPPLHRASCKATWVPWGCVGPEVTSQGLCREHGIYCV